MRTWRSFESLTKLALLSALPLALACSTAPLGAIVIAIRTDVSIPKDIDRIIVDVTLAKTGASVSNMTYEALNPDHTFKLPATLVVTASEKDPGAAVRIRVIALRGVNVPRMVREVVTTVPADRTVVLPIAIEFLCDGMAELVKDAAGLPVLNQIGEQTFKSTCIEGKTCSVGRCVDVETPEVSLAVYSGALIFGGGTGHEDGDCFDATSCFDGAPLADVNMTDCTITAGNDVNVGLVTQGGGSCGASGCFVPLDADSDAGWQPDKSGTLRLPPVVCEKIASHALGGVVTVPAGKSPCSRKASSLPICGAFSSAGTYIAPSTTAATVVASGQQNPVALGLEETPAASRVYWTTRGTFDDKTFEPRSDGAVKQVKTTGEEAVTIAKAQASPHDLVVSALQGNIYWSNASGGALMTSRVDPVEDNFLITGLGRPEGIAIDDNTLLWTDLTSNEVSSAPLTLKPVGASYGGKPIVLTKPNAAESAPRRIAASNKLWCWTYEIKLDSSAGIVSCLDATSATNVPVQVATKVTTPRSIAVVTTTPGMGTVYFTSFASRKNGGGVYSVPSTGGPPTPISAGHAGFEDGEEYPNGVAVEGGTVYWTSRTRGAVMRLKGGTLTEIASDQRNPGAIVVGKDEIYWVNEGTNDKGDGAIVRHAR